MSVPVPKTALQPEILNVSPQLHDQRPVKLQKKENTIFLLTLYESSKVQLFLEVTKSHLDLLEISEVIRRTHQAET